MELTHTSQKFLYEIYSQYKKNRKAGMSIDEARSFKSALVVKKEFFPTWLLADVEFAIRELCCCEFIEAEFGDNTIIFFELTHFALRTLESKNINTLKDFVSFLTNFIP